MAPQLGWRAAWKAGEGAQRPVLGPVLQWQRDCDQLLEVHRSVCCGERGTLANLGPPVCCCQSPVHDAPPRTPTFRLLVPRKTRPIVSPIPQPQPTHPQQPRS